MLTTNRRSNTHHQPAVSKWSVVWIALACLLLMGSTGFGVASAQGTPGASFERTVIVSPEVGNPAASGQALLDAVSSIQPTAIDRWSLVIEPGIYDLGAQSLTMKPWLDIRGSGIGVTVIQGLAQDSSNFDRGKGVVIGADNAALRFLTVRCLPSQTQNLGACITLANPGTSPLLRNLRLESSGFGTHWGIRNTDSDPVIEEISIAVSGGDENYGIVNAFGSRPVLRRVVIESENGQLNNFGILDRDGSLPESIHDSQIYVRGGDRAIGIYDLNPSVALSMDVIDLQLEAENAAENYGILDGNMDLLMRGTLISTGSPGSAIDLATFGRVEVSNSELGADVFALRSLEAQVGSTIVRGGGQIEGASQENCGALTVITNTSVNFHPEQCPAATKSMQAGAMSGAPVTAGGYASELTLDR